VLFGGMQIGAEHLAHFLRARRSVRSALFVARRVLGHVRDIVTHGRGMRPAMGNALIARLAKSVFDLGIPMLLASPAVRLVAEDRRVNGALLQ
jgi:hypothetical protein